MLPHNIRIFATEATREAPNSAELIGSIRAATGLEVTVLKKEEEGRLGAVGILSSVGDCRGSGAGEQGKGGGVCVDLGGGSCQFTWLAPGYDDEYYLDMLGVKKKTKGGAKTVSVPLGAAALVNKLGKVRRADAAGGQDFEHEIGEALQRALSGVSVNRVTDSSKSKVDQPHYTSIYNENGIQLYLSGGGLRAWGYLLMSTRPLENRDSSQAYPINHINGYTTNPTHLHSLLSDIPPKDVLQKHPRISTRRATQLPATAGFLRILLAVLPPVSRITFAQGGLREGALLSLLPPEARSAVAPKIDPPIHMGKFEVLLRNSVPHDHDDSGNKVPEIFDMILPTLGHSLNLHSAFSKEDRAAAALRASTTGDIFAGADHGIIHSHRAALAVALCERWGGYDDLPVSLRGDKGGWELVPGEDSIFYDALLRQVLSPEEAWWAVFLGRVAAVLGEVYPAGKDLKGERSHDEEQEEENERLGIEARWASYSKKGYPLLKIDLEFIGLKESTVRELYGKAIKGIEKIGKKRNWPRAASGESEEARWGIKTDVTILGTSS